MYIYTRTHAHINIYTYVCMYTHTYIKKFSKVSALLDVPYTKTTKLTFEKFPQSPLGTARSCSCWYKFKF